MGRLLWWMLLVLVLSTRTANGAVFTACLKCICKVESNCQLIGCNKDGCSDACGPFQIHFSYWIDCKKKEPATGCNGLKDKDCWEKCATEMACSEACIQEYMDRYKTKKGAGANCESFARLHNGGPNGMNKQRTEKPNFASTQNYWNKIKAAGCNANS